MCCCLSSACRFVYHAVCDDDSLKAEMKTSKKVGGKLVGLDRLRNRLWLNAVLAASGQKSIEKLVEWLSLKRLNSDENKWYRYSAYDVKPGMDFVDAVNKVLPGTERIFRTGSAKLPLFTVLDRHEGGCKRVLSSMLGDANLYRSGRTLAEKCQILLQYIAVRDFGKAWCCPHYDFDVLIANKRTNAIAKSGRAKNLEPRTMLAIVAMWNVADLNDDLVAEEYTRYLMKGILGKPLESSFGKDVAAYVAEMFDESLKPKLGPVPVKKVTVKGK